MTDSTPHQQPRDPWARPTEPTYGSQDPGQYRAEHGGRYGGGGEGSGIVLSSDGLILTNNHVVADAADGGTLQVSFSDHTTASATIVGRDPSSDLAVIRAKGVSGLTPATLGSSSALVV